MIEWLFEDAQLNFTGGDSDEYYADKGGELLAPLFYLINFIADAIVSNLENIMLTGNFTFSSGIEVLSETYNPDGYDEENADTYEVNLVSFLPNIGTAIDALIPGDEVTVYQYPNIKYTPEEIFAGEIDLLSIDFISGKKSTPNKDEEGNIITDENGNAVYSEISDEGWQKIRNLVSQWYQILRMVAIIGLLSALIYTGIKIIISANARDKAKYKEWILNWLLAVGILFFMHIIMAFIISLTGEISQLLSEANHDIKVELSDGNSFVTNLMGFVRFMIQSENFYIKVGYEAMYIALIFYTLKFTLTYLKRVLNMAFLTLIAPIVALTYPIEKINDGKAQGFDMWIKEYIFNALLQPMHLILYYVLVGSAVSVAAANPIYGIVVLAFMSEAERLLKRIFGFDKASAGTVGGMASAFTAGAIASNIGKIAKMAGGNGGSGNADAEKSLYDNPKAINRDSGDDLFEDETVEQRMLDAYDEDKFGTDDYDSAERESMAREANSPEGRELGIEEQREMLREQGWSEEDINDTLGMPAEKKESANTETTKEETKKEKSKFARGAKAVGKKIMKPVWDFEHGAAYNGERLIRKAGRAALGAGLGVAAATVQAGISITDGKYNPAEGLAAFGAGYAGGGKLAEGFRGLEDAYKEGTLPDNPKDRDKEIMRRAKERFSERDDVIKYNKKYAKEDRENVINIQKQLLEQGVTDLKEMDSCIKYIKKSNGNSLNGVSENLVKKSRVMHDFASDSHVQNVRFDADKKQKYIQAAGKDEKERRILQKKFDELEKYMDANKK